MEVRAGDVCADEFMHLKVRRCDNTFGYFKALTDVVVSQIADPPCWISRCEEDCLQCCRKGCQVVYGKVDTSCQEISLARFPSLVSKSFFKKFNPLPQHSIWCRCWQEQR